MSAFIVNDITIDAIVTVWRALRAEKSKRTSDAQCLTLGRNLLHENYRSVGYRYDERSTRAAVAAYRFTALTLPPSLGDAFPRALGAVSCYEYQACECGDWEASKAHAVTSVLRAELEKRVPWLPCSLTSPAWQPRPHRLGWDVTERDALCSPATVEDAQSARRRAAIEANLRATTWRIA